MPTSLVVEDGSIVTGANSFVSLEDADAYHALRGSVAWAAATTAAKEAAIVQATDYLCGLAWQGYLIQQDQPLCWPRSGVYSPEGWEWPWNTVPAPVVSACCVLAVEALSAALEASLERGGQIQSVQVPGAVSVTYAVGAPAGRQFPAVERLLRGMMANPHTISLARC